MASTYEIFGRFTGVDGIAGGFRRIDQAQARTTQNILRGSRAQHSALDKFAHSFQRFYGGEGMFYARNIFRSQIESMKPFIDEAMKLSQAQMKFRAINLPEIENQRAFAAVAETVKNLKGMRLNEVTETMTDLHTATGDLSHALEGLQVASKFRFAFQTMMGDKFSPEQVEQAIQRGFKYLEITGVMQQGQKAVEERFNAMVQMMAATGGRVTPDMLLLMAQRGGPSTRSLSVAGMRNMAAPLQELGAARAGTALMSMYQQLVGGRGGGQPAMMEFMRLGLLPKGGVEFTKAGMPKRIKPGAFGKFAEALQEDPLKASDMLVRAMAAPLTGKAVEGAKELVEAMRTGATLPSEKLRQVRQELAVLFGNRMAQSLMDIFVTQRPQIVKEANLAETAKNIEQLYDQAIESPAGKLRQFESAVANLEATVGGPLLDAVTKAATGLMPFVRLMGEHPRITLFALASFKLASAITQIAMAARLSGFTSLFAQGAGGAAASAVGGGGAAAARAEWEALFGGGGAATGRLAGIAAGAAWAGAAALAITSIAMIIQGALHDEENEESARQAGDRIGQYLRERFEHQVKGMGTEVQEELDKRAAPGLAKDIIAQQGLKGAATPWYDLFAGHKSRFLEALEQSSRGRAAEQAEGTAPLPQTESARKKLVGSLYESGIMSATQLAEYLKQAREMLSSAGRPELAREIERLAEQAFPALYAELSSKATPSVEDFAAAVRRASGALDRLGTMPGFPIKPFPGFTPPGGGLPGQKKQFDFQSSPNFKLSSMGVPKIGIGAGTGPVAVQVHNHIGGEVSAATIERIRTETLAAARQGAREVSRHLDDRARDREQMI